MESINRQLLKRKADALSEAEVIEILEYIEVMESLKEQRMSPDPLDEAIVKLLSEAMHASQPAPVRAYRQRGALKN